MEEQKIGLGEGKREISKYSNLIEKKISRGAKSVNYEDLEKYAEDIASAICSKSLTSSQLFQLFPQARYLIKNDIELMKIVFDDVAHKRYILSLGKLTNEETGEEYEEKSKRKTSCIDVQYEGAVPFLTSFYEGGVTDDRLMKELIDSLIIGNYDGYNSQVIKTLVQRIKPEIAEIIIAEIIIRATNILKSIDFSKDDQLIDGIPVEDVIVAINKSLRPILLGGIGGVNIPDVADDFISYLSKDDKKKYLAIALKENLDLLKKASNRFVK